MVQVRSKKHLTKCAVDGGDSAAFSSISRSVASIFFSAPKHCPYPPHLPVMQTIGPFVAYNDMEKKFPT
ncbi:MAG: hypothetical protein A2029_00790 [Chloroflexi bacterium RBG_19FT_COMBO_47_9]|nr:MAG: hypothetical protein A2029_00790 [Chloroflexi bacterium RBG_19FT_COMBO_47_9]